MVTDREEQTGAVLTRPQKRDQIAERGFMKSESWSVAVAELGGAESYAEAPAERVAEIERSMDAIFETAMELVQAESDEQ